MHLSQKQIVIIGAGAAVVVGFVVLFAFGLRKTNTAAPVSLSVWGTADKHAFEVLTQGYAAIRPNVTITYTELPEEGYAQAVVSALASGNGPDVFMIGDHGLRSDEQILAPAAPTQMSPTELAQLFPAAVEADFTDGGAVYALPLSLDTLALFYNKDLFDQAAVANPPATWNDFQADVSRLRAFDATGQVVRAGAALGGSEKTVSRAADIVFLLMLQNGAHMTNADATQASFASGDSAGLDAFNYYLQFANAGSAYYTWNDAMQGDQASFAAGKTGMMFGYAADLADLANKNPFLNIGVAPAPQTVSSSTGAVAYPRYEGLAVSRQSKAAAWGWDFVANVATNEAVAGAYLAQTGEPPALRTLIAKKIGDAKLDIFARQALLARSWAVPDDAATDAAINGAIASVLTGQADAKTALARAEDRVTSLLEAHPSAAAGQTPQ